MTQEKGILRECKLPDGGFTDLWSRIKMPKTVKSKLIAQILLSYTMRGKVPPGAVPLHGLILLTGPPGTGKTSLAKGAASMASQLLKGDKPRFLQVEPHGLTSGKLGQSQRDMHNFLTNTIAERAQQGRLIVLLDEVETLAVDRQKLSLDANPIDVHRATDAVLAGLDHLADEHPGLLFIATTNFEGAVDEALLSRADLILHIDNPTIEACEDILRDTLEAMGEQWAPLKKLATDSHLHAVAKAAVGLDGRKIRKGVIEACASSNEVAQNPGLLTLDLIREVFEEAHTRRKGKNK